MYKAISGGSGNSLNNFSKQTFRFCHLRFSRFPLQHSVNVRTVNTPFHFRIINITESADASVMTGQIQAALDVQRTIVRAANAFIYIDTEPESRGPFVPRPMAFAGHVYLICSERVEVAILVSV